MEFLNVFKKKETLPNIPDDKMVAVCDGEMIPAKDIKDEMFSKEALGKTVGFIPSSGEIVAPCNGVLEVMFPTGHAFAIRMKDGTGVLVHVGINTVDLDGNGFDVHVKQGSQVKAGQKIVDVDLNAVKKAGYDPTTMLIITEGVDNKEYSFSSFGQKTKAEVVL